MKWFSRQQLWCSSIILYSITSIAYDHHTDITSFKHMYLPTDMIFLGHELTNKQLNAHCTELEGGRYTYNPPLGTILKLGEHILELLYECEDRDKHDYGDVVVKRTLLVQVAKSPEITWLAPQAIPYVITRAGVARMRYI